MILLMSAFLDLVVLMVYKDISVNKKKQYAYSGSVCLFLKFICVTMVHIFILIYSHEYVTISSHIYD